LQTFAPGRQERLATLNFVAVGLTSRKNHAVESDSVSEPCLLEKHPSRITRDAADKQKAWQNSVRQSRSSVAQRFQAAPSKNKIDSPTAIEEVFGIRMDAGPAVQRPRVERPRRVVREHCRCSWSDGMCACSSKYESGRLGRCRQAPQCNAGWRCSIAPPMPPISAPTMFVGEHTSAIDEVYKGRQPRRGAQGDAAGRSRGALRAHAPNGRGQPCTNYEVGA
jgi:hypothetical protein